MPVLAPIDLDADKHWDKVFDLFLSIVFLQRRPSHFAVSPCVFVWYGRNAAHAEAATATTAATLRSLDKWIIRPLRLYDARPFTTGGFTLPPVVVSN